MAPPIAALCILTGAQNKIKNLADKAKAYVNNVSELELKVLEATNHDPWGPHGSVMQGGHCLLSTRSLLKLGNPLAAAELQGPANCVRMQGAEALGQAAAADSTCPTPTAHSSIWQPLATCAC